MKAFEKWNEDFNYEDVRPCDICPGIAKESWKACLEWLLNPEDEIGHCSFMKCSFADRAEKELENKP